MPPRSEYPRPQFRRHRWVNLNGEWWFAFDDQDTGLGEGRQRISAEQLLSEKHAFSLRIVVPFCYQAPLSGIGDSSMHDVVWYARVFDSPVIDPGTECLLLHFGAVDYRATVWVNGNQVAQHEGGHTPFCADITHALREHGNVLVVRVEDPSRDRTIPRGKQAWTEQPEHIFYTRTTGIWQTVWLEPVSRRRIEDIRVTPQVDSESVEIEVAIQGLIPGMALDLRVELQGRAIARHRVDLESSRRRWGLSLGGGATQALALWSPDHPHLYDLHLKLIGPDGDLLDVVDSYFGMRKLEARDGRVYLNGQPLYQRLVLDQGYFPTGVMTAPTDDDLRRDIELAQEMGFNGARKHQKAEDPRWLYWADQLGFLVWGEMANAHEYSTEYVQRMTAEWQSVIRRDYNHPCIVVWVPINESWGGRRADGDLEVDHLLAMYHLTRSLDTTRLIVANDGWEIVKGDLCTIHDYAPPAALAERFHTLESALASQPPTPGVYYSGRAYNGEPIIVSEFGGISLRGDHGAGWGYSSVFGADELVKSYGSMIAALQESPMVQGFCYTQLTDVEQESNGLLTEDRKPKADLARIKAMTTQIG